MKRLLMYSQDGMGLGHLRRSSNIAAEVLACDDRWDVLILADSPATRVFTPRPGLEVVKLPTVIKTGSASWKSTSWRNGSMLMDLRRVIELRAHLILQTFKDFEPDAVLVDHMPVGALGELKPMLDFALDRPAPPRLFLGLRDILDTPAVIRRVWRELGAYDYLRAYDAVLVYGCRDIYDAAAAYHLLPHARAIVYCNYVPPRSQHVLLDHRPERYILVTGGGGADAFPLENSFLEALPLLNDELDMDAVMLTGPNMQPRDREALLARATPRVRFESGFDKAQEWIRRATVVITMGGYNSLCEVLKWQKKAVVVPRPGPSSEQRTRARLFRERRLVRVLDSSELAPERLAEELVRLLDDDGVPDSANSPPLDGAQRAAAILTEDSGEVREDIARRLASKGGSAALAPELAASEPATRLAGGPNPIGLP